MDESEREGAADGYATKEKLEAEIPAAAKWELPFPATESFRLLGRQLGYMRTFRGHMMEARKELRVRQAVLNKVSNTKWGLGNRILTFAALSLIESAINYGLAITGSAVSEAGVRSLDTIVMNPVARETTG